MKTVYALYLRRGGEVPKYVKAMYLRHLEIWNNFHELCNARKDWFDVTKKCTTKHTAEDFEASFKATFQSIAKTGFNVSQSLIPVRDDYFPINGAHRISSAIALQLPSMPVQRVSDSWTSRFFENLFENVLPPHTGYCSRFFFDKGFEPEFADFAMLQWMLHVQDTSTVIFWPEAASDSDKMAASRDIVARKCGTILYEKTMTLTRSGLASLVFHAYGDQAWLEAKVRQLQKTYPKDDTKAARPIIVVFIIPKSAEHLVSCKEEIRAYFSLADPKSSVHIPDYHKEASLVGEMVLNPNSRQFLDRHHGEDCRKVANNIARRLRLPAANPDIFVLPQDIMVDSGAAMSFFDIRPHTDVDILFQGAVLEAILGEKDGIILKAHTFQQNRRGISFLCDLFPVFCERPWGAEHISSNTTVDDLFTDPVFYGYCHGVKFVSVRELIRYKLRRGERNKDDKDVSLMKDFLTSREN